jgi:asparagine synthetase B (glutamine-hydrolysing)
MIEFILEIPLDKAVTDLSDLFVKKPVIKLHISDQDKELIAWGDPIEKNGFRKKITQDPDIKTVINELYGHFYFLLLNKKNGDLAIGNSLFSILPVYYTVNHNNHTVSHNKLILSDNAPDLGVYTGHKDISSRFVLETILFNYPLFNSCLIDGIYLLPANSYLKVAENQWKIIKHTSIEEFFSSSPEPWKKSIKKMTDVFLSTVQRYLSEEPFITSLTGGFDGRTLAAAGLYLKKEFSCYCFGTSLSRDMEIAMELAHTANLRFKGIYLDESYIKNHSLPLGKEFIQNASGGATFSRAHYLYASKLLSSENPIIITGNFGSEIFRAVHIAGVIIAPNLQTLFLSRSLDEALAKIKNSPEVNILNKDHFEHEWKELQEDLIRLSCYNDKYHSITPNQRFYVFVFEEIFRKYFGAEMVNQFRYLANRTPFLDIEFIKEIFKTKFAGIHSDLFDQNPFRRFKGQVLYAHIIKKAYPAFGMIPTDKLYRPDDIINFLGKTSLLKGYLEKRLRRNNAGYDPLGVDQVWEMNRNAWFQAPITPEYYKVQNIKDPSTEVSKEILFKILSLSYMMKHLESQ